MRRLRVLALAAACSLLATQSAGLTPAPAEASAATSAASPAAEPAAGGSSAPPWLRERVPPALRGRTLALEHWQWLFALILLALGLLVDRATSALVRRALAHRLTRRLERIATDQELLQTLRPLGLLAMVACWWLGLFALGLPERPHAWALVAVEVVTFVSLLWVSYRLVDLLAATLVRGPDPHEARLYNQLVPLARKAVKVLVAVLGAIVLAANLGADVTGLIAGLGLGGLAIALAAQDVLKNFFGSLTVLFDRPFQVGDLVRVAELEGVVEEIGFRSTRLRTAQNSLITLPNANLINAAVDNLGARHYRCYRALVGLRYDTPPATIEAFCAGVRELVRQQPLARRDQDPQVFVHELGAHSIDVLVNVFFETQDLDAELAARHRLIVGVLELAERQGVGIAFPTRTVKLEQTS